MLSPGRMNSRCKSPEIKKAEGVRGAERSPDYPVGGAGLEMTEVAVSLLLDAL